MLTLAEEVFLLVLDDENGQIPDHYTYELHCALIGAALIDLAFANRIDADLSSLFVVDEKPTGDVILDRTLGELIEVGKDRTPLAIHGTAPRTPARWIKRLVRLGPDLQAMTLHRLIEGGILKSEEKKLLWMIAARRYPVVHNAPHRDVRLRMVDTVLGSDLPQPRDAALVALIDACRLWDTVMPKADVARSRVRIDQLRNLDLIGRGVIEAVSQISTVDSEFERAQGATDPA